MRIRTTLSLASFGLASLLAACQGNVGSGSGLSIPATAPYNQPGGPVGAGGAPQTKQRVLDGAVYLAADMTEIPLPTVDGYGVTIALGTPTPTPTVTPIATPAPSLRPQRNGRRTRTQALAAPSPSPNPAASAASPAASASPIPSPSSSGSSAPSLAPSGPVSGAPTPATTAAAKTTTKTIVFPEGVPDAPTPQPSGNVQTFPVRKAIVRGFISPATTLSLYGLGAIRFTIPKAEQTAGRGYTIAVFVAGKRRHETVVSSDSSPTLANDAVASTRVEPFALKKGTGYALVLYGDELAPTPGAVPSGYASPGVNPFVTPLPGVGPTTKPTSLP